ISLDLNNKYSFIVLPFELHFCYYPSKVFIIHTFFNKKRVPKPAKNCAKNKFVNQLLFEYIIK
ncbi:hypothetical protein CJJ23_00005, partial [Mycoplasmopsis agassizii]